MIWDKGVLGDSVIRLRIWLGRETVGGLGESDGFRVRWCGSQLVGVILKVRICSRFLFGVWTLIC